MSSSTRLLTPGPLALAPEIKACMQTDLGSRDGVFRQITQDIRRMIQDLAGAGPDYTVIPVQGSGTFAIEAALTSFLKPSDKVLVCVNGVYGELVVKILGRHGLGYAVVRRPVGEPIPGRRGRDPASRRPDDHPPLLCPSRDHLGHPEPVPAAFSSSPADTG